MRQRSMASCSPASRGKTDTTKVDTTMPLPGPRYLYKRTSARAQGPVALFLRFFPYTFLVFGYLVSRLIDTSWIFLAGGAIFIALMYPCMWAEVKLQDRQQAKASFKDTP